MNLQQMRALREAVRQKFSLTRAADALLTSQPGVSKAIAEFEAELAACRAGTAAPKVAPGAKRYRAGTVAHTVLLCEHFRDYLLERGGKSITLSTKARP